MHGQHCYFKTQRTAHALAACRNGMRVSRTGDELCIFINKLRRFLTLDLHATSKPKESRYDCRIPIIAGCKRVQAMK
jgi:hypothetical protein